MPGRQVIDVKHVIENARLGRFQIMVAVLSGIVIMLDGYDVLAVSFAAPSLARVLGVPVTSLGPVFGAGFLGLLIGSLIFGPLGDIFGRKRVLLGSTTMFGIFSLMPIFDLSWSHLLAYRFITGFGLAGAMPCAIALTSEYAPKLRRGLLVTMMFAGFALGAVLGGALASQLVPIYGWQAAFWIGGLAPLGMVLVLAIFLPESAAFLTVRGRHPARIAAILRRIDPATTYLDSHGYVLNEPPERAGNVADLFARRRGPGTLLLWLMQFCVLVANGSMASWLPSVLMQGAMPMQSALLGPVMMQLAGVFGTMLVALVMDRAVPALLVAGCFAVGGVITALNGVLIGATPASLALVFLSGFFMVAAQFSCNTVMATFYPTRIRSTGVGWALGIGRIGAVLGPSAGGWVLAQWSAPGFFLVDGAFAIIACAAALGFAALHSGAAGARTEAEAAR